MISAESIYINVKADELVKVSIVDKKYGVYKRVFWLEAESLEDSQVILNGRYVQKSIWFRSDEDELSETEEG